MGLPFDDVNLTAIGGKLATVFPKNFLSSSLVEFAHFVQSILGSVEAFFDVDSLVSVGLLVPAEHVVVFGEFERVRSPFDCQPYILGRVVKMPEKYCTDKAL